jgi:hypothetical protein
MKICFYGFAGYRYILLEFIKLFGKELDWSIILPTYHRKEIFYDVLGKEKVCYLYENFNEYFEKINSYDYKNLIINYGGNFYEDLMADKVTLKKKNAFYQEKHGIATYLIYKKFLEKEKPDFLFFPQMESHEARILFSICKELSIKTIVYTHARNYGVSYYSKEYWQQLPSIDIDNNDLERGKNFVFSFRKNPTKDVPEIEFDFSFEEILKKVKNYKTFLSEAVINNLKYRFTKEKHYHVEDTFIQKIRTRYIKYTENLYYKSKSKYIRKKYFSKITLEELKHYKYIYFPLQITPESSTNNFEPYYVDQVRAIDLLRKSMPNDYLIVLKDHPAYFGRRSFSFYEKITNLPGTILVDYSLNSLELIKNSQLVSSITGTANLEALLLGKKSLLFGKCFFLDYLYKYDSYWDFPKNLNKLLKKDVYDEFNAIDLSARVLKIGKKFILFDPLDLYFRKFNVTLSDKNLKIAYETLKDFMNRYGEY